MSKLIVPNDLDRAIIALLRSTAATPEFYRQLAQGEFWFLVKYHPEIEGTTLELTNGSPFPFVRMKGDHGPAVPLFSSAARAEEALAKWRTPPRTFSLGSLPAKLILEMLGKMEMLAVVNMSCATGQVTIPANLMRDLASGKALQPLDLGGGKPQQLLLTLLDPADYPTDLLQPVFDVLRRHKNFRAAWVFGPPSAPPPSGPGRTYYLQILMEPRDAAVFHDLNMVVQSARGDTFEVEMSLADETNPPDLAQLFQQAKPFYVAADYRPPVRAAA